MKTCSISSYAELTDDVLKGSVIITTAEIDNPHSPLIELAERAGISTTHLREQCSLCNRLDLPLFINNEPNQLFYIGIIPSSTLRSRALPKRKIKSYLEYIYATIMNRLPNSLLEHGRVIFALDNPAKRLDPSINRIIDDVMLDMHYGDFSEVIIAGGFPNSYYDPDF